MSETPNLLSAANIAAIDPIRHVHQFNERALRITRTLGERTGLERIGIHLVRLPAGCDSTQFHYHDADEEFIYVLEGRAVAEIGDERHEIGPGDFMGFPAPSPPHNLHNPHSVDLVYLVGGERNACDVVHYPRVQRSMLKAAGRRAWVEWSHLNELPRRP
jgi:uncharacterized cupin superfamily protein